MRLLRHRSRGQALVMVTIALIAMCGLMGLAVDLGWSFYVRKAAQAAADSAALAAAKNVYKAVGASGTYDCSNTAVTCQSTPLNCSSISTGNLYSGCLYAQQNGFTDGGNGGRQVVTMQSDVPGGGVFNTATGPVTVAYWVTARAKETVPQLFSAVLGNANAVTGAKATAAVADSIVNGSLILMNRQNDRADFGSRTTYGVDLQVQANDNQGRYALQTAGNIRLYSSCAGSSSGPGNCQDGNQNGFAGQNGGGGTIYTLPAGTQIRSSGSCTGCPQNPTGSAQWVSKPTSNAAGPWTDPMGGFGQPAPPQFDPTAPAYNHPYNGGQIVGSNDPANPLVLPPGNYYATTVRNVNGSPVTVATGDPIQISGYVRFSGDATFGGGGTIFYGGVTAQGSANGIHFNPGVYVFAGVRPANNNTPGVLLDESNNFILKDNTASKGQNSDPGSLLILTDLNYVGGPSGNLTLPVPQMVRDYQNNASASNQLQFGTTNLQAGNNGTYINLHGLNPDNTTVQNSLYKKFAPTLFWQDQRNATVKHDPVTGLEDYSCSGGNAELPCTNTLAYPGSPEFTIQASPAINLYGLVYQPRGAWAHMGGGGGYSGPLMLISGALWAQGNSNVNLGVPTTPLRVRVVALIE